MSYSFFFKQGTISDAYGNIVGAQLQLHKNFLEKNTMA